MKIVFLHEEGIASSTACVADALYVFVALMWLVPDRRIELRLSE